MIIQLLFLITFGDMTADDLLPDFYAVKSGYRQISSGYKIYSKVRNCKAYQSGDQVLYQEGDLLKIASLNLKSGDLECQSIRSNVDSDSFETRGELPREESEKILFTQISSKRKMPIEIEILKKCEEKIGFGVYKWKGNETELVSREQCSVRAETTGMKNIPMKI